MTYTDFIFTIADIIIVQRTARKWLAVREVNSIREARDFAINTQAATSIQKVWRGYKCHMNMIYTLVHIIIVQSVARRFIARKKYERDYERHVSARKIQAWIRCSFIREGYVLLIS